MKSLWWPEYKKWIIIFNIPVEPVFAILLLSKFRVASQVKVFCQAIRKISRYYRLQKYCNLKLTLWNLKIPFPLSLTNTLRYSCYLYMFIAYDNLPIVWFQFLVRIYSALKVFRTSRERPQFHKSINIQIMLHSYCVRGIRIQTMGRVVLTTGPYIINYYIASSIPSEIKRFNTTFDKAVANVYICTFVNIIN